ncbi:hypothetical protein [Streptomyces shenzhenensis]|uniref:hypothetical protein n=1 Tax=Streptomyces shenzhenensis TaxID=943815 RepID=UPI0015F0EAD4|nr:hypothetical protein [Streptomyces shenzhenensis]
MTVRLKLAAATAAIAVAVGGSLAMASPEAVAATSAPASAQSVTCSFDIIDNIISMTTVATCTGTGKWRLGVTCFGGYNEYSGWVTNTGPAKEAQYTCNVGVWDWWVETA